MEVCQIMKCGKTEQGGILLQKQTKKMNGGGLTLQGVTRVCCVFVQGTTFSNEKSLNF